MNEPDIRETFPLSRELSNAVARERDSEYVRATLQANESRCERCRKRVMAYNMVYLRGERIWHFGCRPEGA